MSESNKGNSFEELYLQQKKKNSMLMVIVVVLAIATAGSLMWGLKSNSGTGSQRPPSGFQGGNGQGFPGGGMRQMDFTKYFKDDGSVDTDAVNDFAGRLPSGAGSQFVDRIKDDINQAAKDGKITQTQADALIKAFESAAEGSSS